MDEFPPEALTAGDFSNQKATKDEVEGPSAGADDVSQWCTTMAIKKHNAVGDNQSDNDASDSNDHDEEEELSSELKETELDELTAKAFTHSFTNSQCHNFQRSWLGDDNMRGDIKYLMLRFRGRVQFTCMVHSRFVWKKRCELECPRIIKKPYPRCELF